LNFIVNELKHRAHLKKPIQTPNDQGGFDLSYETLLSFWMGLKVESAYLRAVRGENTSGDGITQIGKARYGTFEDLGKAFTKGFSYGFKRRESINPIKGDYFLFVEDGNSYTGRMFRVKGMARDEEDQTWMLIQLNEIEEQGTGASA
jgi:hypothetical protein